MLVKIKSLKRSSFHMFERLTSDQSALVWVIAVGALITFFINALIDNSVVFHDEYVYKAASDLSLSKNELYEKGLIEYIPNRLYVAVYQIASYAGQNFYIAAQLINVVFWALGIYATCSTFRLLDFRGSDVVVFSIVLVVLPFSIYTKYFMPESMYFFAISVSIFILFAGIFEKSAKIIFTSGVVTGLAFYIKPHSVILFTGTLLFLMAACKGRALKIPFKFSFYYFCGFLVVLILGRLVIHKPQDLSSLGVYDQMIKGLFGASAVMLKSPIGFMEMIGKVAIGNLILVCSVWGLSLYCCLLSFLSFIGGPLDDEKIKSTLFNTWILILTVVLLTVIIGFTVLAGEVGRIHSRYYFFLYPFLLISLFAYQPGCHSKKNKIVMTAIVVGMSFALLLIPGYSSILAISLVSDSPELGFAFYSKQVLFLCVFFLVFGLVSAVWYNKIILVFSLIFISILSNTYVRNAQGHIFRGPYTDGKDALVIEQLLGKEKLNSSLVVSESRDALSKFLFNISATPYVKINPRVGFIDVINQYKNIQSFILLTDKFESTSELQCQKAGQMVFLCVKK